MKELTEQNEKGVVICINCLESIKGIYDLMAQEGDDITFYFCMNKKCPRYALASIVYGIKTKDGEIEL